MRAEEGSGKILKITQVAKEITRCARNLCYFGSHRFKKNTIPKLSYFCDGWRTDSRKKMYST